MSYVIEGDKIEGPGRYRSTVATMLQTDLFQAFVAARYSDSTSRAALYSFVRRWNEGRYTGQPATVFRLVDYNELILLLRVE